MIGIGSKVDASRAACFSTQSALASARDAFLSRFARVTAAPTIGLVALEIDAASGALLAIVRATGAGLPAAAFRLDAEPPGRTRPPTFERGIAGAIAVARATCRSFIAAVLVGLRAFAAAHRDGTREPEAKQKFSDHSHDCSPAGGGLDEAEGHTPKSAGRNTSRFSLSAWNRDIRRQAKRAGIGRAHHSFRVVHARMSDDDDREDPRDHRQVI
jgi:hypothetical protein